MALKGGAKCHFLHTVVEYFLFSQDYGGQFPFGDFVTSSDFFWLGLCEMLEEALQVW